MKEIEIFDPAMCCSTGVCGPSVDKNLLRIATLIDVLPITLVAGEIAFVGQYPSTAQMSEWSGKDLTFVPVDYGGGCCCGAEDKDSHDGGCCCGK